MDSSRDLLYELCSSDIATLGKYDEFIRILQSVEYIEEWEKLFFYVGELQTLIDKPDNLTMKNLDIEMDFLHDNISEQISFLVDIMDERDILIIKMWLFYCKKNSP